MKRFILCVIAGLSLLSVVADRPKKLWDRNWDQRSFYATVLMLGLKADDDGVVTDEELVAVAVAGFRVLEPEDKNAKLTTSVHAEGDLRVVFVAYDYGTSYRGYALSFSKNGRFEKLVIVPSE